MFHLSLATPEKTLLDEDALSLTVPGTLGYMEILSNHAPLISTLQAGKITIITPQRNKKIYTITSGVIEVLHNQVLLLVDTALPLDPLS